MLTPSTPLATALLIPHCPVANATASPLPLPANVQLMLLLPPQPHSATATAQLMLLLHPPSTTATATAGKVENTERFLRIALYQGGSKKNKLKVGGSG